MADSKSEIVTQIRLLAADDLGLLKGTEVCYGILAQFRVLWRKQPVSGPFKIAMCHAVVQAASETQLSSAKVVTTWCAPLTGLALPLEVPLQHLKWWCFLGNYF
jgi:hypothetical protein